MNDLPIHELQGESHDSAIERLVKSNHWRAELWAREAVDNARPFDSYQLSQDQIHGFEPLPIYVTNAINEVHNRIFDPQPGEIGN